MKKLFSLLLVTLCLLSCRKEIEQPYWDVDMIFPIAHTNLDINNMISDTATLINTDQNGFVSLVFQENLMDIELDSLIKIDAIADEQTHTLDSASFADITISDTATIGESINEIPGLPFLLPNGSTSIIPAIPNIIQNDTINVDASEYFETMTLYKGTLSVSVENNFPTDISNLSITLINGDNQNNIASFTFPLIPTGSTVSDNISIGGQTIDENILAVLNNMDINASNGPVLINYNDAIITTINISDIGITEATAIFPEQQLTEKLKEHSFDLGISEITEIGIKEGTVKINVLSTLPNGKIVYNIPSLTKNGIPFTSGDMIIPQANNTDLTTFSFDFEGYVLDLTGEDGRPGGDTVNTIYTEAYTFIDYTGTLEEINQTDSFYSFIEFDLTTEYAKGYIGQDTFDYGPEIINTDIFNSIYTGSIDLESANMSIGINNHIGADASFKINNLSMLNNNTEVHAPINNNTMYNIERAEIIGNNEIIPTYTEINIEASEMLEILPNKINTSATFFINPNGQSMTQDFLYPEESISANINLKVPLSIISNKLTFIDTTEINTPNEEEFEIEKIYLTIENGFPLSADLQFILLDAQDIVIDTLISDATITAGKMDENNIVIDNSSTTIEMEYSNLQDTKKIIVVAAFNTEPVNEYISIYSNYKIGINLSAKINKRIGE